MRIKIGSLKGRPGASLQEKRSLAGDFLEGDLPTDVNLLSPIVLELTVTNTGKGLLVTGSLEADVQYQCTRCLQPFTDKLKANVEEFYRTTADDEETFDDEEDFFPDEVSVLIGDEIDLTDALRESLLLAIPMKLVCDDTCPGLCIKCGKPLKDKACDCNTEDTDIRFAPLLDLLKDLGEDRGEGER